MIIDDLYSDFYRVIRNQYVVLMVNLDVDAICTLRMLMCLFKQDDVSYSIYPITSVNALRSDLPNYEGTNAHMAFLNFGNGISFDDLPVPSDITVYILDSKRPCNLDNIYNSKNVKVLLDDDDIKELEFPKEYVAEKSDEENDGDNDENASASSSKELDSRKKREADEKIRLYYECTWVSSSSTIRILDMAHRDNRTNLELMWCTAVGLSSQLTDNLISFDFYSSVCIKRVEEYIGSHCTTKKIPMHNDGLFHIYYMKELMLPFYSHWCVSYSLICDEYFYCRTRFWKQEGLGKLKVMLARIGLTLDECRRVFNSMTRERMDETVRLLYNEIGIDFYSFVASIGYTPKYNALDFARILSSYLEITDNNSIAFDCLMRALGILITYVERRGDCQDELLNSIIECKNSLYQLTTLVSYVMNHSLIKLMNSFFILIIPKGEFLSCLKKRYYLSHFIHRTQDAFVVQRQSELRRSLPLIVAIPVEDAGKEFDLIMGIMPKKSRKSVHCLKSVIGNAFTKALRTSGLIDQVRNCLDPSAIMIEAKERIRFLNTLKTVFEVPS